MNANSLPSFGKNSTHVHRTLATAVTLATLFALAILATPAAQAQTFTVIHNFTGGADGAAPIGLTIDAAGNLYGPTGGGGSGHGTVFELKHSGSAWVLTPLYSFAGGNGCADPYGGVALAHDGSLYGTVSAGGNGGSGCVFQLTAPPAAPKSALVRWNITTLYAFTGGRDGGLPWGDLTLDPAGNIYGVTAYSNGELDTGVIYQLRPSRGGWKETVLYSTQSEGTVGGFAFDKSGSLYGVFSAGGGQYGAVYELSPSGSSWTEQIVYGFTGGSDGGSPGGGLITDSTGNLYGTTRLWGDGQGGTVFQLTPGSGGWSFTTLYGLSGGGPSGPRAKLFVDAAGNLYGTTYMDGAYGKGSVFKLTPSNGGWTYTSLHDFTGGSDGALPMSNIVSDANGNLYGTAQEGGTSGNGVVFEITP